jgi:LPS O-antigen subunit length determinant protein (WzzB/FepE family)
MTENQNSEVVKNPSIEYTSTVMDSRQKADDELDLVEIFLSIWKEKKYIGYSICLFFIIGIIIAFTSKEEYTVEVKLLPEGRQQSAGFSLAQQFGLGNIQPAQQEGISLKFYPDIASSNPFLISFLDFRIYEPEIRDSLSLLQYFNEYYSDATFITKTSSFIRKYTLRLPFTIASWFSSKDDSRRIPSAEYQELGEIKGGKRQNVLSLSNQELRVINRLRQRIIINNENGMITITTKMPDPNMAADLAEQVTISLIDYIKSYRTEKSRFDVEFVEERYNDAQRRFEDSQRRLALFRDESHGQLTQLARTEEQRLQSEYELAFNVYNTLARRLEESRLNLQEETPVVIMLEPAIIPNSPSEPKREFILTIYVLMGIIIGFGIIFIKLLRIRIRETILRNKGI